MTITAIPVARHSDGYIREKLSKGSLIHLKSNINVDQELWSILDQYSEIKETGEKYLKSKIINPTKQDIDKIKKSYLLFRACCRQAKNYYFSAKTLPNKSSALLYYYSFMNLAKALIISRDPVNHQVSWTHGLSENRSNSISSISQHTVKTDIKKPSAIFQSLYKIYFGINPNFQKLKIKTLLSYCSDIGFQYQNTTGDSNKLIGGYVTLAVDRVNKKGWGMVAIEGTDRILKHKSAFKDFFNSYEKVVINQIQAKELFDFNAQMLNSSTIYQEKNIHDWSGSYPPEIEVRDVLNKTLENRYQINLFDDIVGFYLTLPYGKRKTYFMNEPLAIYIIFFYLSSLVRYRPDFLEHIYEKKDMWLLDSFIRFCPETLLRNFISMISGTDYVLIRR